MVRKGGGLWVGKGEDYGWEKGEGYGGGWKWMALGGKRGRVMCGEKGVGYGWEKGEGYR